MRLPSPWPSWLFRAPAIVAGAVAIILGCTEGGLREDAVLCEEAVARLGECCPGLDETRFSCRYKAGTCSTSYPDFTSNQGECIREMSCADVARDGFCDADGGAERVAERVCGP